MKRYKYIFTIGLALLSVFACKEGLQEINTDPNVLPSTKPEYMFPSATSNMMRGSRDHLIAMYGGSLAQMQYITAAAGVTGNGYYLDPASTSGREVYTPSWSDFYGRGNNLFLLINEIDRLPEDQQAQYAGLRAMARVVMIWEGWRCIQNYGAMPYTQAFLGRSEGIDNPKYDYIWDLYKIFDEQLKEASTALSNSPKYIVLGQQDFFFKGDYLKWMKFTNALRLRIAMYIKKADNAFFEKVYSEVAKADLLPSSNDESCLYHHPSDFNDDINDILSIRTDYAASLAFVDFLKRSADPRLRIFVRRNEFRSSVKGFNQVANKYPEVNDLLWSKDNYWGIPTSPKSVADTSNWIRGYLYKSTINPTDPTKPEDIRLFPYSQIQGRFFVKFGGYRDGEEKDLEQAAIVNVTPKMQTPLITYSDVCFMLAECAVDKGGSVAGKTDNQWYQEGIRASIAMYFAMATESQVVNAINNPLQAAEVNTLLASDFGKLSGNAEEKKQMILSQLWAHSLLESDEAYASWKRTGYPKFEDEAPYMYAAKLERAYSMTNIKLVMPRRTLLPRSTYNASNRDVALRALMKGTQSAGELPYGEELETKGRIWWDR